MLKRICDCTRDSLTLKINGINCWNFLTQHCYPCLCTTGAVVLSAYSRSFTIWCHLFSMKVNLFWVSLLILPLSHRQPSLDPFSALTFLQCSTDLRKKGNGGRGWRHRIKLFWDTIFPFFFWHKGISCVLNHSLSFNRPNERQGMPCP